MSVPAPLPLPSSLLIMSSSYPDYFLPQTHHSPHHHPQHNPYQQQHHQPVYSSQSITLHHPHELSLAHQMQQPPPSPPVPIDPALALYPPQY